MWKIDDQYSKSLKRHREILRERKRDDTLGFVTVKNGVILPYTRLRTMTYGLGGVVDSAGHFMDESAFWLVINRTDRPDWGGAYELREEETETHEEKVIFGGFINNNEWGHFLTDWSVRLWYASFQDRESRVVFCERGTKELHPDMRRVMELAGIGIDRILLLREGDSPVRFSEIVIPDASLTPKGFTPEYKRFFEAVGEKIDALNLDFPKYPKIYLTRTGIVPSKDFGEDEIEDFYRRNGYEILRTEQLGVDREIFCFRHCAEVASLEGSGAHNILFSKPGLKQTILEKTQAVNERQIIINQCCDTDVTYVGTYPKVKFYDYYSDGPFLVGITKDFQRYARARGFAEQPRRKISVWLKNYAKYLTIRPYRRVKSIIEKGKRHFGFSSRTA